MIIKGLQMSVTTRSSRALGLLLALAVAGCHSSKDNPPAVEGPTMSPSQAVLGKSYGEWGAAYWQWLANVPPAQDPVSDGSGAFCDVLQSGSMWFLTNTWGGSAERSCTISKDKYIYFPLVNGMGWLPDATCTTLECFQTNFDYEFAADKVTLSATLDGADLGTLTSYRVRSGAFVITITGTDNMLGESPGSYDAISDGYAVILKPLQPGSHTLHFTGEAPLGSLAVDVIYHLTIE